MADPKVGEYLNDNFCSAHQKVGTFQTVQLGNGRVAKQGGNVASYFCTPDGTVVHAVAGPVKADVFLREARWAVEVHNLAATSARGDNLRYRLAVRKAHLDRLAEQGIHLPHGTLSRLTLAAPPSGTILMNHAVAGATDAGKVSALLAAYPVPKIEDVYPIVWERVLNEQVSTAPVRVTKR